MLPDRWVGDKTPDEIVSWRDIVIVSDGSYGNFVMNMLEYISEYYEGDGRTFIHKDGDEIIGSYRLLLLAHVSRGFDSWVVLNSLVEETTDLKIITNAR